MKDLAGGLAVGIMLALAYDRWRIKDPLGAAIVLSITFLGLAMT